MNLAGIEICRADAEAVIELRLMVLRAGLARESAVFAGDEDPRSRHWIAVFNGKTVGCVTLHASTWEESPAWQLRGMAVAPELRNGGVGAMLLRAVEGSVRSDSPMPMLWCNARVPAVNFYRKHGWRVVSEEFEVPTAGPHVKMLKRLDDSVR